MTDDPHADARYDVLPAALRQQRRSGAGGHAIQMARARAYIARLEGELASDAEHMSEAEAMRKHQILAQWRSHLATLSGDDASALDAPFGLHRHAAE